MNTTTPLATIVIPVFNDESVIEAAIDSCLGQTLDAIEVIVVDDASTDDTAAVVEEFTKRDARVRLIRQRTNMSAFQARRAGVLAARAEHLMFLDGDDELTDSAAETALSTATASGADLVQFGVDVVRADGTTGGAFEGRLQPRLGSLRGTSVLTGLFPIDSPAQGQLWRYMFRTEIVRDAYALMPDDLVLPRVNDLPIAFLVAALATSLESVPERLYRYHFGRGGSGQKVNDLDTVRFYAGAIGSIDSIASAVAELARRGRDGEVIRAAYASVRLAIIGYTTHYLAEHTVDDLRGAAFEHLAVSAPASEIVHATAKFWPATLDALAAETPRVELEDRSIRNVLLTTNTLRTGGISGVLLAQAHHLARAGFGVTIVAREPGSDASAVPNGVAFAEITGDDVASQLEQWVRICRDHEIDAVIDHHWLYSTKWPSFALASRAEGIPTIGWAHNSAGRSVLLGLERLEFQTRHVGAFAQLVVLSPLDVAFWKLQGMPRVTYLPNPPSPLLMSTPTAGVAKAAPVDRKIELIWWGRLDEDTKRVSELIEVAAQLKALGADFHLRIIGPDWAATSAETLNELARTRGLSDRVDAVGPLHGIDLLAAVDAADVFVNTSVIEGYPLTIPEAQSRGLPVAMYELPWLAVVHDNAGIVSAPQGDAAALARQIVEIASNRDRFAALSRGSIAAARRELDHDFAALYPQLLTGRLPASQSPEPTLDDAQALIDLTIHFAEQNAKTRKPIAQPQKTSTSLTDEENEPSHPVVRVVTPLARTGLRLMPWLRPTARRVKHALLRR